MILPPQARDILARHLLVAGFALTGLSGLSAEAAWLHMRALGATYGVICGSSLGAHCALCPLTVALLAAGLVSLAAARASRRPAAQLSR